MEPSLSHHWSAAVIGELRALDREAAPHGLYGLREAHRTNKFRPTLQNVLNGPKVRLYRRLGGSLHGGSYRLPGPRMLALVFCTYADTKVRKFGSVYRLDSSSRVDHEFPDLSRELPDLAKAARTDYGRSSIPRSFGYLLIGHFRHEKDGVELSRQATAPDFLDRYGLACVEASWPDVHGRDFQTCLRLWYIDAPPSSVAG